MVHFEPCNCSTVNVIQWSCCTIAISVFIVLQYINAPYGRYKGSKSLAWIWRGSMNANFAWFLQELPSFIIPVLLATYYSYTSRIINIANAILLCMFCVHYFHSYRQRFVTTTITLCKGRQWSYWPVTLTFFFPLLIQGGTPTPLLIFLMSFTFCSLNGYLQGCSLMSCTDYPHDWTMQPRFYLGIIMFFSGMAVNVHSDHILRNLRKSGGKKYKIPNGGMFTYVSGANYFGEIVEWCGFAVACWSVSAVSMALFTTANLAPRAFAHHRWYKKKFAEDYPKNRTALIPFLC